MLRLIQLSGLVFFLLITAACTARKDTTYEPFTLQQYYDHALYDAAVLDQSDVHPLTPIPPNQTKLIVTNWTSYPAPSGPTTGDFYLFVTIMPEIQNLCKTYAAQDRDLLLEMLLGLPQGSGKTNFLVLEVNRADLLRPCIDPDVGRSDCDLSPPKGWQPDPDYLQFLTSQMLGSYQRPNGYPFTRLGYTYDWNPATSKFGLDEYVLKPNSAIKVLGYSTTEDFCK